MIHVASSLLMLLALALPSGSAIAQTGHEHGHGQAAVAPGSAAPVRITMDALHAAGGVPPGWRFTLPAGDVAAGRRAFADFKCYACHAVKGEDFPSQPGQTATAGPELTGMGSHHPAGYLAESIVNPSAVLIDQPGYIGGDGRSIMPTYPDMTLAQLINLVAYLQSLTAGDTADRAAARTQTAGGYRVRLLYQAPDAHAHHHGATPMPAVGHLLVFLADENSGQAIPYASVSAAIEVPGKPTRSVKLEPSFGPEGFHYGADVALPDGTSRIAVSIGPTTMRLGPGVPDGLKRPQRVTFDWK